MAFEVFTTSEFTYRGLSNNLHVFPDLLTLTYESKKNKAFFKVCLESLEILENL